MRIGFAHRLDLDDYLTTLGIVLHCGIHDFFCTVLYQKQRQKVQSRPLLNEKGQHLALWEQGKLKQTQYAGLQKQVSKSIIIFILAILILAELPCLADCFSTLNAIRISKDFHS